MILITGSVWIVEVFAFWVITSVFFYSNLQSKPYANFRDYAKSFLEIILIVGTLKGVISKKNASIVKVFPFDLDFITLKKFLSSFTRNFSPVKLMLKISIEYTWYL